MARQARRKQFERALTALPELPAAPETRTTHREKSFIHVVCVIHLQQELSVEVHGDHFSSHSKNADTLEEEFHILFVQEGTSEEKQGLMDALLYYLWSEVDV